MLKVELTVDTSTGLLNGINEAITAKVQELFEHDMFLTPEGYLLHKTGMNLYDEPIDLMKGYFHGN